MSNHHGFLPPGDRFLDQDLVDRARRQAVGGEPLEGAPDVLAAVEGGFQVAQDRFVNRFLRPLGLQERAVGRDPDVPKLVREHARERMGKNVATRGAIEIGAAIFGLGNGGRMAADIGGQLLTLRFGREDESEADLVGMELTARAGYDPRAGVSLWEKMGQASKGAPPEFLSTHPSGPTRIKEIQTALPQVTPLYARAPKPSRRFSPPPKR